MGYTPSIQNKISTLNSSAITAMAASQVFQGTSEDISKYNQLLTKGFINMKWISDIAAGIISPVATAITSRNDNKTKIKQQNIKRIVNADDKLAEWERIQAENGAHSWKDEFWTIVLSIPAIGCFIPGGADVMIKGFEAMQAMPEFYQAWLGVAVLSSFGIRVLKR